MNQETLKPKINIKPGTNVFADGNKIRAARIIFKDNDVWEYVEGTIIGNFIVKDSYIWSYDYWRNIDTISWMENVTITDPEGNVLV